MLDVVLYDFSVICHFYFNLCFKLFICPVRESSFNMKILRGGGGGSEKIRGAPEICILQNQQKGGGGGGCRKN